MRSTKSTRLTYNNERPLNLAARRDNDLVCGVVGYADESARIDAERTYK
jgi:hypothetical protein